MQGKYASKHFQVIVGDIERNKMAFMEPDEGVVFL